jgi:uncharacterized protein (TIGR00297 family)
MLTRAVIGLLCAGWIALVARRARALSPSGALAATSIGTAAVAAGWAWGIVLVAYFVTSTALSRAGRAEKERRTAAIVAKGGERDAVQVLANGLIFALSAVAMIVHPAQLWLALGIGSLAASAADTWATEIGTLYGTSPRSILTGRRVVPGTSGGVSLVGFAAAIAGALFVSLVLWATRGDLRAVRAIAIGGVAGAVIDSVLGATVQCRRWCDACARETERLVHDCGRSTRAARGLRWLDNDAVNFVSSALGGVIAALLAG